MNTVTVKAQVDGKLLSVNFKDGQDVNGKSIMGVLLLVAAKGSTITITCDGEDAQPCLESLTQLVQTGFGED